MKDQKIVEVLNKYEEMFSSLGINPIDFPHNIKIETPDSDIVVFGHCYGMIPKMRAFLCESQYNKLYRWLGFIQGVLWSRGVYDMEELKNHNRPENLP